MNIPDEAKKAAEEIHHELFGPPCAAGDAQRIGDMGRLIAVAIADHEKPTVEALETCRPLMAMAAEFAVVRKDTSLSGDFDRAIAKIHTALERQKAS